MVIILSCGSVSVWAATADGGFTSTSIVCAESPTAIERFALDELDSALARLPQAKVEKPAVLRIVVGQPKTNKELNRLLAAGSRSEKRAEGYTLRFSDNTVLIAGVDERGTLYGVMDFIHYHLRKIWDGNTKTLRLSDAPRLELRGIWSWGGRIYNYKKFFDQMARWKMNLAILWHLQAPGNAIALQEYAASRGITIVWGYSWGWNTGLRWDDPRNIAEVERKILDAFEKEYTALEPFGIYFQSETEGGAATGQGAKFIDLVNGTADRILRKHPGVWISCGVHFSSFLQTWDMLRAIDPRLNIMYEDIPGMPFTYRAGVVDPETVEVCRQLVSLRGKQEDVGFVLKGFHNNPGHGDPQLIEDEAALRQLAIERPLDPGNEAGWRNNLSLALDVLGNMVASPAKRKAVTLLMEDGLWEIRPWFPVCLAAEAMWNPNRKVETLVAPLESCDQVYFVSSTAATGNASVVGVDEKRAEHP
jgi:hypothetical protein